MIEPAECQIPVYQYDHEEVKTLLALYGAWIEQNYAIGTHGSNLLLAFPNGRKFWVPMAWEMQDWINAMKWRYG